MRLRTAVVGVAAAAALAALPACGGPRYQYVQNDDFGVYAKVPAGWSVYDEADLFPEATKRELDEFHQSRWMRTFGGGGLTAQDSNSLLGTTSEPLGLVKIEALTPEIREQISLRSLRGFAALGDPNRDLMQDPAVKLLKDEPVTFEGGYNGVHTVFETPTPDGDTTLVVDSTALLNKTSSIMYVFKVSCTSKCYFETHKDEIAKVVDSWTIQEVR
jgi:hypothetical protein